MNETLQQVRDAIVGGKATAKQIAAAANVDIGTIYKIVANPGMDSRISTVSALAKALEQISPAAPTIPGSSQVPCRSCGATPSAGGRKRRHTARNTGAAGERKKAGK